MQANVNVGESPATDWLRLIQGEYLESPGLNLTKPQVQRLWGLDPLTCDALIETLVTESFLKRTDRGGYVLAGEPL
jgi:hypothetical protein